MNQPSRTSGNRTLTVVAAVLFAILIGFGYGRNLMPYLVPFVLVIGIGSIIWLALTSEPGDSAYGSWPLEDLDTHLPPIPDNDVPRDDRIAVHHDSSVA